MRAPNFRRAESRLCVIHALASLGGHLLTERILRTAEYAWVNEYHLGGILEAIEQLSAERDGMGDMDGLDEEGGV